MRYHRQSRPSLYFVLSLWFFIALIQVSARFFAHGHDISGVHWLDTLEKYTPYACLAMPIVLYVVYFFSYYEVQPSALEIRSLWWRRSIPYSEINRIAPNNRWYSDGKLVEIRYSGLKKLPCKSMGEQTS